MIHETTFHAKYGSVVLFENWVLSGAKETYLSCILIVFLGFIYQGIRFARFRYGRRCPNLECRRYILNRGHLVQTVSYTIQFVWGYFLMLAVMTYNLWILVAVLAGMGLGYFFFGWGEFEDRCPSQAGTKSSVFVCESGTGLTQNLLLSSDVSGLSGDTPSSSKRCVCDDTRM